MKTYELIQNYDEYYRVTVGPDVRCRVRGCSYEGGPMHVVFEREFEKYESECIAAYNNVRSCVLLDDTVTVETLEYTYDEKQDVVAKASPRKGEWVDASKK